jgi:hypothetical protein
MSSRNRIEIEVVKFEARSVRVELTRTVKLVMVEKVKDLYERYGGKETLPARWR